MFNRTFLTSLGFACAAGMVLMLSSCGEEKRDEKTIRIGHFPNVTHVQSLIARNMERNGKGWFEKELPGYKFEWFTYNAGPSAMEAIFARSLDVTYVGPSPAINAYAKSKGEEVRILAGAANGGAALVVPKTSTLKEPKDFKGATMATPQLGNTQDISARAWLTKGGLNITQQGGDCRVLPTANPDQMALFQTGKIDACWTVEPWVSRLEMQADGKVIVDEASSVTTILAARQQWLKDNPELAKKLTAAHASLTKWIVEHPEEAQKMLVDELSILTRSKVDPALIASAWKRIILTDKIDRVGIQQFVDDAKAAGFLKDMPALEGMIAEQK